MCGQRRRGGRRGNAVLGDRLVAEEVSGEERQQSFGELRAQTVVDVCQHSGNCGQEPAATKTPNCQIHVNAVMVTCWFYWQSKSKSVEKVKETPTLGFEGKHNVAPFVLLHCIALFRHLPWEHLILKEPCEANWICTEGDYPQHVGHLSNSNGYS